MTATAPANTQEIAHAQSILNGLESYLDHFVVGQQRLRESLLIGLLSSGHLLLESVPGLAKTTAAAALANAVAGKFSRIQCTPDLLPADIIGSQIYNAHEGSFNTVLGPVHANIVLLDEINRSSAKTQSAMLEAMQEKQTTIGGRRFELPRPFLVMATQNPIEQEGTYQLPEAQLDRFMIKDLLTHPNPNEEVEILSRLDSGVFDKDSVPDTRLHARRCHDHAALRPHHLHRPRDHPISRSNSSTPPAIRANTSAGSPRSSSTGPARAPRSPSRTPAGLWRCSAAATTSFPKTSRILPTACSPTASS